MELCPIEENGYEGEHDQDTPEKDKDTDQVTERNGNKGKEKGNERVRLTERLG